MEPGWVGAGANIFAMRGLSFGELLDYCSEETTRWRDFFQKNPAALELATDIAGTRNVRELVLHVVVVQMRYAERLLNLPITEYESLTNKSGAELFALSQKSFEDLRSFAVAANDPDWDGKLTFPTRTGGTLTASRRKIFIHALLHGVRHWAQLASFLRQQGYTQEWPHDFIFSSAIS
jgi:uncharacterized damage-inducible protein DinB